jgi:transposase
VDESGFAPTCERTHGWAPTGQKVYGLRCGHRRPRTSLLAAQTGKRLRTAWLFEGTCKTAICNAWLEQELCPLRNGDCVVIIDNAAFHKAQQTRSLIESTGAILLFLPPSSPDLRPIETTFGNIKRVRAFHTSMTLEDMVNMFS